MSKLSDAVKALINAGHASPGYTRASAQVQPALSRFAAAAAAKEVGLPAWVTVSTAVGATLNCPEALTGIFELANQQAAAAAAPARTPAQNAELIREVGLKCISFNGIPRSINTLGAFHAALPPAVAAELARTPATRGCAPGGGDLAARQRAGRALWDSVYAGFEDKLLAKLARSHPDLPVHILEGHYAGLLANPPGQAAARGAAGVVGRVLTSLVAVACLRAQTGVGPQVTSHVFGLRKAYERGAAAAEPPVAGGPWLASDDGNLWLLEQIDGLVRAIAGDAGGTTFAPGLRAKL